MDLNGTGMRIVRFRTNAEVPEYYTELNGDHKASSGSGLFRYQKIYWAIGARSADRSYKNAEALRRGTLQYDLTLNVPIVVHLRKWKSTY